MCGEGSEGSVVVKVVCGGEGSVWCGSVVVKVVWW